MEIKMLFLMLISLSLFITSGFLNGHQVLSSHDLGQGHEQWFSFHAMPRKLMLINSKVESVAEKGLVSYNDDLSGKSTNGGREEETTTTTLSKVSMKKGSYPTHMFTMDYSPVRRRRPVHNKALPTTTTSP